MDEMDTSYDLRHRYRTDWYPRFTLLLTVPEIVLPQRFFTGFGQVIATDTSYN